MDAAAWDQYHRAHRGDRGWAEDTVIELLTAAPAGRALDLGAGAGRHALWLANRGWSVTAMDFSAEARAELGRAAAEMPAAVAERLTVVDADLTAPTADWLPTAAADLTLLIDVDLPESDLAALLPALPASLAPGGGLLVQVPVGGDGQAGLQALRGALEPLVTLEYAGVLPAAEAGGRPSAFVFGRA